MTIEQRYILNKKIARGGMAEIYLGKQIGEDGFARICCFKRILPHFKQEKEFIEMFRDEAHIGKRLSHANIVRVEGFEEVENSYALVMEFVIGSDLRTILYACEKNALKIPIPVVLYIISECARGLHYAHTKKDEITQKPLDIVHRDVSPQNILVSFEGEVKITDFGIADAESKITDTRTGIVKGKFSYMSPEQVSAKKLDARSDIFALAIVFWEMLALRRLFQGENDVDTIQKVRNCEIDRDILVLNTDVDESLKDLVMKGLRKDLKERYATAEEMERAIRRYLNENYPSFTQADVGGFLASLLPEKKVELEESIKELLSTSRKFSSPQIQAPVLAAPSQQVASPNISELRSVLPPASRESSKQNPADQKPGSWLFFVSIFVLIVSVFAYLWVKKEYRQGAATLATEPKIVRVFLDGRPLFGGKYVETPFLLKDLSLGSHKFLFERPGFQNEILEFNTSAGSHFKKTNIRLKVQQELKVIHISFLGAPEKTARIFLDDGLLAQKVKGGDNLDISDVVKDSDHTVSIFPFYPEDQDAFSCLVSEDNLRVDLEKSVCL